MNENIIDNKIKRQGGFTLIELIAVIAILGVFAVILVPNIVGFTNKAKVIKAQSDSGIIIRAIDAYEAENSQKDQALILVSRSSGTANDENNLTLNTLVANDNPPQIIGEAVKVIPDEFTSDGNSGLGSTIAQIKISDLRKISNRQSTITVSNSTGRIEKIDGVTVNY